MDPRVVRTRAALQHALLELIQEQRWEKITVQDLLDRTGISRSTFYAHFANKLDVLTGQFPDVADMLAIDQADSRPNLLPLLEHVEEMADVFAPLLAQPVLGEIAAAIEGSFVEAFAQVVDTEASPRLPRFLAGALLAVIREYTVDAKRPLAAAMAVEIESYLEPLLAAKR